MRKLQSSKNKKIKILYDCMGNQKLQLVALAKEIPFAIGQDDMVTIFPSGALIERYENKRNKIAFVGNDGKALFDMVQSKSVKDLQAVVFDSGVLVIEMWQNNKNFLQYYTYTGEIIVAGDIKNLVGKVLEFEQEKGLYDSDENQITL